MINSKYNVKDWEKRYLQSPEEVFEVYGDREQTRSLSIIIPTINRKEQGTLQRTVEKALEINLSDYPKIDASEVIVSNQTKNKRTVSEYKSTLALAYEAVNDDRPADKEHVWIPKTYHFHLEGKRVQEILNDYLNKKNLRKYLEVEHGKGENMYWASLVSGNGDNRGDDKEVILFWDDDHRTVSTKHMQALALPAVTDDILFVKAAFQRHHYEDGERYQGGRVNATVGRPKVKLLNRYGLMPDLRYPLTGEVCLNKELLKKLNFASRYGIEILTLLQTVSGFENFDKTRIKPENFLEVHIGKDFDEAHRHGKRSEKILDGLKSMGEQITVNLFGAVGNELTGLFGNDPERFMKELKEFNREVSYRWAHRGKIAANFELDELNSNMLGGVGNVVHDYFGGKNKFDYRKEFLPSMNTLEEEMGSGDFNDMMYALKGEKKQIFLPL